MSILNKLRFSFCVKLYQKNNSVIKHSKAVFGKTELTFPELKI